MAKNHATKPAAAKKESKNAPKTSNVLPSAIKRMNEKIESHFRVRVLLAAICYFGKKEESKIFMVSHISTAFRCTNCFKMRNCI